jgi:prophage maintenance system killer protein
MECVARKRTLTKAVIHELHAILTQHQETTTAKDQFGKRFEIPLLKGKFKELPNNPERPDGMVHEYCPVIHVDAEIERLLTWLEGYGDEDPVIVSAWLHHRFTQIHPYQDGNGRVARALTTMVLLRAGLLPLVIDRDVRVEYIKGLEAADAGDLSLLAALFARNERGAILQALSIDVDAEISHQRTLTGAVIESVTQRLRRRVAAKQAELRRVNDVALALRGRARRVLEQSFSELRAGVGEALEPEVHVADGGPDRGNAHWYRFEVVQSARDAGKFANFSEEHYFVKSSIRIERERLVLIVSLHHVGQELSGVMEATAFARLESFEDSEDRDSVSRDFFLCSLEPFVFTYRTKETDIGDAFARWLDAGVAVAIKEYGDRL